jgi:hypothetical protein
MLAQEWFGRPPFAWPAGEKQARMLAELAALTRLHAERCPEYGMILRSQPQPERDPRVLADIPFLPVGIFKRLELKSVPDEDVFKRLRSSGTSAQVPSTIYLDRATAQAQSRALATIMQDFLGPRRLPMVIVDSEAVLENRLEFSARGAGILGMSTFGRDHLYLLDAGMQPRWDALEGFLERHQGETIFFFGFTFMVWQHLIGPLAASSRTLTPANAVLIHGGGWKRLAESKVTPAAFRRECAAIAGIARVHDFYGMAEQVGSVFVECESGRLHAPSFSEILVREGRDWRPVPDGETGVIQALSVLPRSYPGHSLLTEDLGRITGRDACGCGRLGTTFEVLGRVPAAELRGCSDTFTASETPAPAGVGA